jgi:hypothetical protein
MDLSQEIAEVLIQAASPGAARAAQFRGAAIPVTVRFSDSAPDPVADNGPEAASRGIAIRFTLPDGKETDIVAISHNGFVPHPWPSETFLGSHRAALKFVRDPKPAPVSFATASFYGSNACAGAQHLDDAAAGKALAFDPARLPDGIELSDDRLPVLRSRV